MLDRMERQVRSWDDTGDRRAVFLSCYLRMTESVHDAVDSHRFADGPWVGRLLDRFAGFYFDSVDQWERSDERLAKPWAMAHRAAVERSAAPLQLLLAGVNAHINYDLVLTLVDLLDDDWSTMDAADRIGRYRDYDLINTIIAETADRVQDEVLERYSPRLDLVDRALGGLDERLMIRLLLRWRRDVWDRAVVLLDDRDGRPGHAGRVEARCARRSRWLLI
jgi:hypothetical protein